MRRTGALAALVLTVGLLTGCEATTPSTSPSTSPSTPPDAGRSAASDDASPTEPRRPRKRKQRQEREVRKEPRRSPGRTFLVTHVVDGDTLDLADGRRVRLVGIDTPEVGQCGYEQAAAALERLTLGKRVVLARSDEDRDGYGRLLRYVDVGGRDAGLVLIRRGLAIARYDSRDGYGFHPREPRYVRADRRSPQGPCPKIHGLVDPPPSSGGGRCAPGYDPCVPPYPPDVDCSDVNGPIRVTGDDPHGLDGEGDGLACE